MDLYAQPGEDFDVALNLFIGKLMGL